MGLQFELESMAATVSTESVKPFSRYCQTYCVLTVFVDVI